MLYFQRMTLNRGWIQNVLTELFIRFHAEVVARGILPQWELDNEEKLAAILTELKFSPVVEAKPKPKAKSKNVKPLTD